MTEQENIQSGQTDQPSLLIVDDDTVFCEVLSEALTKRGYTVSTAHNVDDGIVQAKKEPPEFVLSPLTPLQQTGIQHRVERPEPLLIQTEFHFGNRLDFDCLI